MSSGSFCGRSKRHSRTRQPASDCNRACSGTAHLRVAVRKIPQHVVRRILGRFSSSPSPPRVRTARRVKSSLQTVGSTSSVPHAAKELRGRERTSRTLPDKPCRLPCAQPASLRAEPARHAKSRMSMLRCASGQRWVAHHARRPEAAVLELDQREVQQRLLRGRPVKRGVRSDCKPSSKRWRRTRAALRA